MHELSFSQSIVELVVECARREGIRKVNRVVLELGAASAIEHESVRFCFDLVTEDTIAQGAELVIETLPLRARCTNCGHLFSPAHSVAECPNCHAYSTELLGGLEMRVKSFEGD